MNSLARSVLTHRHLENWRREEMGYGGWGASFPDLRQNWTFSLVLCPHRILSPSSTSLNRIVIRFTAGTQVPWDHPVFLLSSSLPSRHDNPASSCLSCLDLSALCFPGSKMSRGRSSVSAPLHHVTGAQSSMIPALERHSVSWTMQLSSGLFGMFSGGRSPSDLQETWSSPMVSLSTSPC